MDKSTEVSINGGINADRREQQLVNTPPESVEEDPTLPPWRLVTLIVSICVGLFLSLMDTTIIATALYTIGVDLQSLGTVTWIALAYTLSYLGCAVAFARIADIVGRRDAYIGASVIFLAFSLGCGFAKTLNQLIACRVLQGIGGSGLYSLTFVILPEISPHRMSQWIAAVAGIVVACSGVLGPVLGGIITHYTTWRWIFWLNAPVGIMPLILFVIAWPPAHQLRPIEKRRFRELDIIGCALTIGGSVLIVFALQQGGLVASVWTESIFLCPLIIGIFCYVLLFSWEFLVASPTWEKVGYTVATLFPVRLIKRRVYVAYLITTMLITFPYFLTIYSLPLRMQVVNGKSPLIAGVALLPMLISVAIGSTVGGAANGKRNNTCPVLVIASCLMTLGTGLLTTLAPTVEVQGKMYGFQVLVGLGFGLAVSTVSLGATLESEVRDNAIAQGIASQLRVLGGSIGIACSSTILGVTQRSHLLNSGIITPMQLTTLQSSARTFTPAQLQAVREAYADAFTEDLKVCVIISGVCVLVTFGAFRRKPEPIIETRKRLHGAEQRRLKELSEKKETEKGVGASPSPVLEQVGGR